MVVISAVVHANPGKEDELKELLLALLDPVSTETGTLEYRIHRALDNPGRFFFYEKYTDRSAIDNHMATPHFKALLGKLDGLIAQPPEIILHEEIGSIRR